MAKKIPNNTRWFTYYNANPRGRKTTDCVIRALATVFQQGWAQTLTELCEMSEKTGYMFNETAGETAYLKARGYEKQKTLYKPDGRRYSGREFCEMLEARYPRGGYRIFAHIGAGHVTAFVPDDRNRYTIRDTWDCSTRKVGNFWVIAERTD